MKTSHWLWSKETDKYPGKNGKVAVGKRNVINNFYPGIVSNESSCTSCHIGYGWRDSSFNFNDEKKIDCLVCHDRTGSYKKARTRPAIRLVASTIQPRRRAWASPAGTTADSATSTPVTETPRSMETWTGPSWISPGMWMFICPTPAEKWIALTATYAEA